MKFTSNSRVCCQQWGLLALNRLVDLFNFQLHHLSNGSNLIHLRSSERYGIITVITIIQGVTVPADRPSNTKTPTMVLQTVDGRRFDSLAEATEYLKSLKPEDR
jgi:hypothetical protein